MIYNNIQMFCNNNNKTFILNNNNNINKNYLIIYHQIKKIKVNSFNKGCLCFKEEMNNL